MRGVLDSFLNFSGNRKQADLFGLSIANAAKKLEVDCTIGISKIKLELFVMLFVHERPERGVELVPSLLKFGPDILVALDRQIREDQSFVLFEWIVFAGGKILSLVLPLVVSLAKQVESSLDGGGWVLWLVEGQVDALLDSGLIGVDQGHQLWVGQSLGKTTEAISELEHRSLLARVGLHAREIPSLELIVVDDAVTVQIQVLEGGIKLILLKLMAKVGTQLGELLLVDGSAFISIVLGKHLLESVVLGLGVSSLELDEISREDVDQFGQVQAFVVELVAYLVLEGIWQFNFSLVREKGGDRGIEVVLEELLLHLKLIDFDGLQDHDDDEVEGGNVLLFQEGVVISDLELEFGGLIVLTGDLPVEDSLHLLEGILLLIVGAGD